jgi:hypothetical protein
MVKFVGIVAKRFSSVDERETFLWQASQDYAGFEQELLTSMERCCTRNEIEALARFHSSPDGRIAMTRLRPMLDEFLTYVMNALKRAGIPAKL